MHLEQLTKTQIVLLTLLVAVVAATASAIVTVSLMSQAPPSVSATVDRIIEKTVQQIVPSATSTSNVQSTKTIVINPNEAVPAAIAAVQKSIIRIVVQGDEGGMLVARGIIVSARGVALTDKEALDPTLSYEAILPDGSRAIIAFTVASTTGPFLPILLKSASTTVFTPATIADPKKLQLGESVVRLSGAGANTAGVGVISALPDKNAPNAVESDLASKVPGAIIIDLSGAVIGMTTASSFSLGETYYSLLSNK